MSSNNDKENEIQVESEFNNLNISDNDPNSVIVNHENCYDPKNNKFWCRECVPHIIIEGWTSGNDELDKLIKDTIYNDGDDDDGDDTDDDDDDDDDNSQYPPFLEWVPFDKFTDIKQIGEGGFATVYSTTWIDGKAKYYKDDDGSWKKLHPKPIKVALKRLNGSQNISAEYLNELKIHWKFYSRDTADALKLYGMTKDPETNEFMMVIEFANRGSLRSILSSNFNNILWYKKIQLLYEITVDLENLHKLGYSHKDFHCGNILQDSNNYTYISDFGLSSKPSNEQKSDGKVYGVLPYIAPEVLSGEEYTISSDIYSFGIIMTELSSGKPPFYERKHDAGLALDICEGLRPEFGKGTPEIYKKLANRCMNANPDQRPTIHKLHDILDFWQDVVRYSEELEEEKFGYKGEEIRAMFKEADKEIPNISISCKKDPDATYTSKALKFSNLSKPISSDSKLIDLEFNSSLIQLIDNENTENNSEN